jgi:hypothetical protein
MKHAGAHTLGLIESMLRELRALPGLSERTPGSFYRRGAAFLHFHEDAAGIFADVKLDLQQFERFRVSSAGEQARFLAAVRQCLAVADQSNLGGRRAKKAAVPSAKSAPAKAASKAARS